MQAINPELRDVQQQVTELRDRLATAEGEIKQLNRTAWDTSKQTIWQFVAFTLAIGALLVGVLNYQTATITKLLDERTKVLEEQIKTVNQRIDQVHQRIDQAEKNINTRFEDLKQEVRNRR